MLNGHWLNAGPLNSPGIGTAQQFLSVNATASATTEATLHNRKRLGAAGAGTAAFDSLVVARRRGLAVGGTATAEIFGGMSVEVGGIVQAYLAAFMTASATVDTLPLTCACPLAADMTATAVTEVSGFRKRGLVAAAAATGAISPPFLTARVNLGELPPGQDSFIGSKNIRAFGFASATMNRRKRLAVFASATAAISPAPRVALQIRMAVAATAGVSSTLVTLYRKQAIAVDATAGATIDSLSLFAITRLGANLTATATMQPTLYMNIFDQAPITRTVFVQYRSRTAYPSRIRREVDA
jgi:hypothetical protein